MNRLFKTILKFYKEWLEIKTQDIVNARLKCFQIVAVSSVITDISSVSLSSEQLLRADKITRKSIYD